MKKYDFKLANEIIKTLRELDVIDEAELGMQEDWFWTAETVYKDGVTAIHLTDDSSIGGINSSRWATPVIQITYKDGEVKVFECFILEGEEVDPAFKARRLALWGSGVLSSETNKNRSDIEIEKFNKK